jgi:hypothetical protein
VKFEVRKYFTREGAISTGEYWNDGMVEIGFNTVTNCFAIGIPSGHMVSDSYKFSLLSS